MENSLLQSQNMEKEEEFSSTVQTSQKPPFRLKEWATLARLPFYSVAFLPFLLGSVIAWKIGAPFKPFTFVISLIAVLTVLLATHFISEYYDYKSDAVNVKKNKFTGGSGILQAGIISKKACLTAGYLSLFTAVLLGLLLQFELKSGGLTLVLGALGAIGGFFYTSKPVQIAYRGGGEYVIAFCYGWLTISTGYYLQAGKLSWTVTLLSLPIAAAIFLVILINEIPDLEADESVNKQTLIVKYGADVGAQIYLWTILAACLVLFIIMALMKEVNFFGWGVWFGILPLILGLYNAAGILLQHHQEPAKLEGICGRTILFNLTISATFLLGVLT